MSSFLVRATAAAIVLIGFAGCAETQTKASVEVSVVGQGVPVNADGWDTYEQLADKPWSELTVAQRQLVAVAELRLELNNGGFDQYFFNTAGDHAQTAVEGARAGGCDPLADLLVRAMELLPGGYDSNREERQGSLERLDPDDPLGELDNEYYRLEGTVDLDTVMSVLAEHS